MGRISLSTLPPAAEARMNGPIIAFIDPLPTDLIQQSWQTFVENSGFRDLLQGVVRKHILGEEMIVNDARSVPGGEGWVHLCDERALPAYRPLPLSPSFIWRMVSACADVRIGVFDLK